MKILYISHYHIARPSTYDFLVTENLRKIVVTVKGTVKTYKGDVADVSASQSIEINAQDSSSETESAYLRYSKDGSRRKILLVLFITYVQ